jgi:hypothetical protein
MAASRVIWDYRLIVLNQQSKSQLSIHPTKSEEDVLGAGLGN